jgi:glycine/D-amino acid oxidase-like deaminating enzyme
VGYYFNNDTDPAADRDARTYERLAKVFFQTFPQLDDVRFTHAWGGPIALTTRMAVHFQRYHGGKAIYAGGYSGFGVSASRFGARLGLALRWIGAKVTMYALQDADEKGGWRRAWLRLVHAMGFPL